MKHPFGLLLLGAAFGASCAAPPPSTDIVASGHVEATDINVTAKVAGRLLEARVKEGDPVRGGDILSRQATTDVSIAIRQAQADREQAQAELRLRLAGARREDIAEIEAQIRATEAEIAGASLDLERMQSLLDRSSGTTKARDDARTRRNVLVARAEAQRETLARFRAGARPEEVDAARARVRSAEARIAQLEQQMSDAVIASPVEGVLTSRIAEPGELLQPGSPICVVTQLADAWLTVYVTDLDLARISLGQEASVRTDGGVVRKGRIASIASKAEFTPKNVQTRDERVKLVYRVKVALDNKDLFFKAGMPAEATFVPRAVAQ